MKKMAGFIFLMVFFTPSFAQQKWINIDSMYHPLPSTFHVYKSLETVGGRPNVMYYAIADLKDKNLIFTADTTQNRRLTPSQFFEKNHHPLLIVNTSFFTFDTHQNLNVVVKDGKMLSYNQHTIAGKKTDTLTYFHPFFSAIGISRKRKADVAYVLADTSMKRPYYSEFPVNALHDSIANPSWKYLISTSQINNDQVVDLSKSKKSFIKWKVQTAVGGGPVLVRDGKVNVSNNIERKFAGKQINDLHPRTAMGYTKDNQIIVFVCEGRSDKAAGLSLTQMAEIMKDLGCVEALNLDGGGSSCMLINGKETNEPSAKGVQRQVPSVFMIKRK